MKTYFSLERNFSKDAFGLKVDYDVEHIPDLGKLNSPERTPKDLLEKLSYRPAGKDILEDMLANNVGWYIFSARIADLFAKCRNSHEVELLPLPKKACEFHPSLEEYRLLCVKRSIPCLDIEESDLRWDTLPDGRKHIAAIYECVLKERSIPDDVDVFQIAEYAVQPIVSPDFATAMAEFCPTGLLAGIIRAVTHQE